jgi:hypothetical protein
MIMSKSGYKIRLGGTNEFVSKIDPTWARASPPGKVDFVEGWDNPLALVYETYEDAKTAANEVGDIEGFRTSVELI